MPFTDKVVVITGAAGGIGQALCRYFAAEGAAVGAIDRREPVEDVSAALRRDGCRSASVVADVADSDHVANAIADLSRALGTADVLINNAGITRHHTLADTPPADFQADVDANLTGAFNCAHAVLPAMCARRAGAIVNIGSVNGFGALGDPAYSAAKAGLISLTKAIALEYGRYNIRANIVCPGTVRTPIWDERLAKDPGVLRQLGRWYPLGRIVEIREVIAAVAFLASDAASAITGAVLPVDCGLSAGNIVMARELTLEDF